jgi:hypothetical protein
LIVGKRNTVIVLPGKYSRRYTVGICIARCLGKTDAAKVLA